MKNFTDSDGWLQKCKVRYGLSFRKLCGESAAVDTIIISDWKDGISDCRICTGKCFTADETEIFFGVLQEKTISFKGDVCNGGKMRKQILYSV